MGPVRHQHDSAGYNPPALTTKQETRMKNIKKTEPTTTRATKPVTVKTGVKAGSAELPLRLNDSVVTSAEAIGWTR